MDDKKTAAATGSVPLAIIGIGCLFPGASDGESYWANIREGVDAITEIPPTHWRVEDYFNGDPKKPDHTYGKRGGFLSPLPFNPMEFNIPPATLEAIDTSQLLGLVAAGQALKDAGYGSDREFDRNKVSVILGVTGALELVIPLGARLGHPIWRKALKEAGVDDTLAEDVVQRIADGYVPWQENSFPGLLGNVAAGRISKQFDLGGTNCVVDAACASSFSALHLATLELATGKSDMVVTGGIDTFNDIFMYMCFSKTPALSATGNAKPFDADGDGTILGEGLGIVVVKRLADAERDGDRIYAVIKGIGSSSDGRGEAIYAPSATGQQKALRDAYDRAGIDPSTIGLLEAHGTGTKVGDAVEVNALRAVYGEAETPWCALGSVKSQIGHTKAAAGAAGLIKAALALHHKTIPPTIKVRQPLDVITAEGSPFYLAAEKRPWLPRPDAPRRAGVSAFGFGGSNFHAVLEEYTPERRSVDWDGSVQIIPFSGATAGEISAALDAIPADLSWNELRERAVAARTAFDPAAACRLVLVAEQGKTVLATLLANARAMLGKNPEGPWQTPDGSCYATGAAPGTTAFLFPGQGSQYTGMLRDLSCRFPQLLDALAAADSGDLYPGNKRLSDLIYPPAAFDADGKTRQEEELRATDAAQPAIGAVSIGAFRVMESFGIQPEVTAGHSYGELTALCAAGRIDEPALHRLSRLRGSLMAAGDHDRGSMLAIPAPLARVEEVLIAEKLDLVIANRNAPAQAVLSGSTAEIVRAAAIFADQGMPGKRLPVAAAFHSPLVAGAAVPFREALAGIDIAPGSVPVYANTTAQAYPEDAEAAKELLAGQLAAPVEFVAEIEALYAAGARTFLEVGPGSRLSGLVKSILGDRPHAAIPLDSSSGKRSGMTDLARLLAHYASLGHGVDLAPWDADFRPATTDGKKPKMTVMLSGANHFVAKPTRPPVVQRKPETAPAQPTPAAPRIVPTAAQPVSAPAPAAPAAAGSVTEALRATRESMALLLKMQEETASLHRRFLESQETASRTLMALLEQQRFVPATVAASPVAAVPTQSVAPAPVVAATSDTFPTSTRTPGTHETYVPPAAPAANVAAVLLAVVSEKTGYPEEMLELEMGLDADLGIDSIKRVEILSAIQERLPGAPVIGPEHLGTLRTLGEIAAFLGAGGSDRSHTSHGTHETYAPPAAAPAADVAPVLLAVVSEKTGYPVEMLELEMGLDADLGIDSIKRVEILSAIQERLPGAPVIGPEHLGTLRTLGEIAAFLGAGGSDRSHTSHGTHETYAPPAAAPAADVAPVLLAVVSEKTGYPVEMLELEMGLDADLGIDSIKRVEILSAIQERLPSAPVIGPEHLGTLRTLGEIAAFLGSVASDASPMSHGTPTTHETYAAPAVDVAAILLAVVSEKTGYPVEMLELEMGLDADLGIDSIKRVEILSAIQERLPGAPVVGPEHLGTLRTLGEIAAFLGAVTADRSHPSHGTHTTHETYEAPVTTAAIPAPTLADPAGIVRSVLVPSPVGATGLLRPLPAAGDFWVTDDGSPFATELSGLLQERGYKARLLTVSDETILPATKGLAGLVICAPAAGTDDRFLENAFLLAREAAPLLRRGSENGTPLLATVSRLDGAFGCSGNDLADPLSGGLAGIAKTAAHEWPETSCRAIDLAGFASATAAAEALADELFRGGPVETGLTPDDRTTPTLAERPIPALPDIPPVAAGDVVVVTGGGRGVTAAAAVSLASAWQPCLVLLGRNPEPETEPAWLTELSDESRIKRAIIEQAGGKLHPREIEERYQGIVAAREIRATIARIEATGATAIYRSVDIRDPNALTILLTAIRREHGPVRGIVHGAGVLADRLIVDKTREQFCRVYETKVAGLRALLAAVGKDDLRFLALFSSTTGRFGRTGQVDYAVANEVLNKLARSEAIRRPGCRTVSINWGPWDGGMVTPSLKKVFSGEGIGLIGLDAGGAFLVRELAAADGGIEVTALAGTAATVAATPSAKASRPLEEAFSLNLTVADYPFLRSHVLDGRAVLPMAVMVEWLSHGALHGNPGFRFHGFNDLRVCKGVVFDQGTPCPLRVLAGKAEKRESFWLVPVELVGSGSDGHPVRHATAEIVLATRLPEGIRSIAEPAPSPYVPLNGELYTRERLFHGPDFQGIEEVQSCSAKGISAQVTGAPAPSRWIREPLRSAWLTDPLAVDCAFQMMILWSFERFGSGSLPCFAGRYRQFHESFPRDGVHVAIRVTAERSHGATADIEFLDRQSGKLVARLEDYECVIDPSLARAFQRNRLADPNRSGLGAA